MSERVDVVALDLGERARDERDELGALADGLLGEGADDLLGGVVAAEHDLLGEELGGGQCDGLVEVTDHEHLAQEAAALRGVEHRQRGVDALQREDGADRGGVLERVDDRRALSVRTGVGSVGSGAVHGRCGLRLVEADRLVQVASDLHQALVAGVGVLALLVHVDERPAFLGGEVAVAATGDEQVGALLGEEAADDGW